MGVAAAVGDPQCGGRAALVLEFHATRSPTASPGRFDRADFAGAVECEPSALLIYRPRSLAVDVHFQELLEWLNVRGANPSLPTLQMLDRGDHGWVEVVAPVACESSEGATRLRERVGGLMAVLHVLEAVDVSSAHLVAHGEYPVLVDAEMLFQSRVRYRTGGDAQAEGDDHAEGETHQAEGSAARTFESRCLAESGLAESILRVGLVPRSGLGEGQRDDGGRTAGRP